MAPPEAALTPLASPQLPRPHEQTLGGSSPPSPPTTTRTPPPASPQPSFVGLLRLAAVRRQVVPKQVDRNEVEGERGAVLRRPRPTSSHSQVLGGCSRRLRFAWAVPTSGAKNPPTDGATGRSRRLGPT